MTTVIRVRDVGKCYNPNQYRFSLRTELLGRVLKRFRKSQADQTAEASFWALKSITFSVARGEAVGIVGRNGSGKTTLLRILSGITDPSDGTVEVAGRFVSLIGLSAGFDFERSGLENVYLNAAIYGLSQSQTAALLDEIVAFSELGSFMQTPIKYYSSGMVARLGFSIAAHIFPEIVFLDEVLAVGDGAFQEKCMDRIQRLRRDNCTVLFVSHSRAAMQALCERVLWLQQGALMMDGPAEIVLAHYAESLMAAP